MSVSVDLRSVGSQAASIASVFLDHKRDPALIGIQPPAGTTLSLNRATAHAIGVDVPETMIRLVDHLIDETSDPP